MGFTLEECKCVIIFFSLHYLKMENVCTSLEPIIVPFFCFWHGFTQSISFVTNFYKLFFSPSNYDILWISLTNFCHILHACTIVIESFITLDLSLFVQHCNTKLTTTQNKFPIILLCTSYELLDKKFNMISHRGWQGSFIWIETSYVHPYDNYSKKWL